jgi:hypothetical protein
MKCMKKLIILGVFFYGTHATGQTAADSAAIRTAALDYVEGFFTADTVRLARGLSPQLVKRIIDDRGGKSILGTMGQKDLIGYASAGQKMPDKNPAEPFKATINIYDIKKGIAIAKISTNKMPEFFDYIQIGRMNGEWKIINVLWAFN